MKHCAYGNHDLPVDGFHKGQAYCKTCMKAYRKAWRVKQKAGKEAKIAAGAPRCPVCNVNPITRRKAKRCKPCIRQKRHLCECGRVTGNPTCGKCRWKRKLAADAERRAATLRRGVNVVTGDAKCAQCSARLLRDPAGNIDMRHECTNGNS